MSQQRRDDVSAKLGSMLLKGYKMLADSCPKCSNVLMQDKRGVVICINCKADEELIPIPSSVMEIDPARAHKLPEHGYSEGFPYRSKEGTPESAYYAEGVLLKEIKTMALTLEKGTPDLLICEDVKGMIKDRGVIIEHIRQCAETIKSLQGIRM